MSFSFNFDLPTDPTNAPAAAAVDAATSSQHNPEIVVAAKRVVFPSALSVQQQEQLECTVVGRQQFKKRKVENEHTLVRGGKEECDVVAGVYEGGFRLWECAVDMIHYLELVLAAAKKTTEKQDDDEKQGDQAKAEATKEGGSGKGGEGGEGSGCNTVLLKPIEPLSLAGKRVAELGCGQALPGIFCAQKGAALVAFQDLNEEVLRECTVPNLLTNLNDTKTLRLFAGDWRDEKLTELMLREGDNEREGEEEEASRERSERREKEERESEREEGEEKERRGKTYYDILLTCDTIYSISTLPALIHVIAALLAPNGVAFVAAKRFYFGVGGSTAEFLKQLKASDLIGESVMLFEDGKSNVREVLRVTRIT